MSSKNILRVLAGGFALVLLLLLAAAWVGYHGSHAIQESAQALVRDNLVNSTRAASIEQLIEQESESLIGDLNLVLGLCLILAFGCSVLTVWFTNRTYRRLEWQAQELSRVSWHMLRDHEQVARRFSHELHDELGQVLTGLRGMMKRLGSAEFEQRRAELVEALDEALSSVRELSQILRPVILDDFGLQAGLRWLCERFSQRTRIEVDFHANDETRLAEDLETHLFRIAQEALTNIARHSGATRAEVRLTLTGSLVSLAIEDNGCGIQPRQAGKNSSLGMVGMRARAREIGGELFVRRGKLGGVLIEVEAPLRKAPHELPEEDPHPAR
jgi:signal transduction histidine kinase